VAYSTTPTGAYPPQQQQPYPPAGAPGGGPPGDGAPVGPQGQPLQGPADGLPVQKQFVTDDPENDGGSKLGRIQFSIIYDFNLNTLTLKIFRAVNLVAKDFGGTSDPYVKVVLLPDKSTKLTTQIRKKNLNPRWNEVFAFEGSWSLATLCSVGLCVYMYVGCSCEAGDLPPVIPPAISPR